MTATNAVAHWMRVLASLDLPTDLRPPGAALPGPAWDRVVTMARSRRLLGPLAWAAHDGRWPVTGSQRVDVLAAHQALVARDLVLDRLLAAQVERLGDLRIDVLALKGPALARRVYRQASLRSYRDIDLLVRGHDLPRAVAAIEATGARRHFPEPRPGFDARFTKGVALSTEAGLEIDLHRTLAAGVHGLLIEPDSLWPRATAVDIGGVAVGVPDLTALTVHAGVHAVLGEAWPQPEVLRDVATALHHPDADLGSTVALASAWQAETVLAFAIGAAWTDLALDRAHPAYRWAAAHRPRPRDLRRIDPYLVDRRDDARQALAATWALPRWGDRARYLRAVALPDAAVRPHRERWTRGIHGLRRGVRR
jgi:hypothetical protein